MNHFFGIEPPPGLLPTRKVAALNDVVDRITADLRPRKLKRDLPSRDRSADAFDVVRSLPGKVRAQLGVAARRMPFVVHCATAASDSDDYEELCSRWTTGHHEFVPGLSRSQQLDATEMFGPKAVKQWRSWMAAEFRARYYAFGTRGLYLRRYFLAEAAKYRRVLGSTPQAPEHWQQITSLMIRSGALQAAMYHRSGGKDYPAFTFGGVHQGRRDGF